MTDYIWKCDECAEGCTLIMCTFSPTTIAANRMCPALPSDSPKQKMAVWKLLTKH